MSDLISRSELLEVFEKANANGTSDLWHITGIKAFIENQPIAYDVERVVKELEEASFTRSLGYITVKVVIRDRAIEIVKGGGVNEIL